MRKKFKKAICSLLFAGAATAASATPSVSVDGVAQRWPWNNKVDIKYTVNDGQDVSSGRYYKIVFTTVIGGTPYVIDGSAMGASATNGTHVATWRAPAGLKGENLTMSASIVEADVPSGDDYMIVDLNTGDVTYEGLFNTQAESNARYNTDSDGSNVYKESKLVFRKVPAGSYPVLRDTVDASMFKPKTTDRDFYIGVYPVTQKQYEIVGADVGATPSYYSTDVEGNLAKHRPVERMLWSELRTDIASTSAIPAVASANTGTFLQRLRFMTGNDFAFDLPTDLMFSIAARAGTTKKFFYGTDVYDASMFVRNAGRTMAVGSKPANAFGLYDVNGNVWEWGLDTFLRNSMEWTFHGRTPFVPYYSASASNYHTWHGGGATGTYADSYLYCGDNVAADPNGSSDRQNSVVGFRVSAIMEYASAGEFVSASGATYSIDTEGGWPRTLKTAADVSALWQAKYCGGDVLTATAPDGTATVATKSSECIESLPAINAGGAWTFANSRQGTVTFLARHSIFGTDGTGTDLSPAKLVDGDGLKDLVDAGVADVGYVFTLNGLDSLAGALVLPDGFCVEKRPNGTFRLVSSVNGSVYTWAEIAYPADSRQAGPDRRMSQECQVPTAYSGDDWVGDVSKAATLTFIDPDGVETTINRTGTGTESFTFAKIGVWTVRLTMQDSSVREAAINVMGGFMLYFK